MLDIVLDAEECRKRIERLVEQLRHIRGGVQYPLAEVSKSLPRHLRTESTFGLEFSKTLEGSDVVLVGVLTETAVKGGGKGSAVFIRIGGLGQFLAVFLGKFVGALKDIISLVLIFLGLLKPDVGKDSSSILHHHSALAADCDHRSNATFDKSSNGIAAFNGEIDDTLGKAAKERLPVLLLPANSSTEGIAALFWSKPLHTLRGGIEDLLAVLGLDIQHIDHRAQYAHRVGLGGLTGIQFALFGDHTGNDPRVYPGLLGDT